MCSYIDEDGEEDPTKIFVQSVITSNDAFFLEKVLAFFRRLPANSTILHEMLIQIAKGLENNCKPELITQLCEFIKPRQPHVQNLEEEWFLKPIDYLFSNRRGANPDIVYSDDTKRELLSGIVPLCKPAFIYTAIHTVLSNDSPYYANFEFILYFLTHNTDLIQNIDPNGLLIRLLIDKVMKHEKTEILIELLTKPEYQGLVDPDLIKSLYELLNKEHWYFCKELLYSLNHFCAKYQIPIQIEWMQKLLSKLLAHFASSFEDAIAPLQHSLQVCLESKNIHIDEAILIQILNRNVEHRKYNHLPFILQLGSRLASRSIIIHHLYNQLILLLQGTVPIHQQDLDFVGFALKQYYVSKPASRDKELSNLSTLLEFIYNESQPAPNRTSIPFFKESYSKQQNRDAALVLMKVLLGIETSTCLLNPEVHGPLTAWHRPLKSIYQTIKPQLDMQLSSTMEI